MKLCLTCSRHYSDEVETCPHEGSQLIPVASDPLLGITIDDRYKVEALIGKGAVGSVYKARHELLGRDVALKVLHGYLGADPESLVRFHREAKALSRLEHPHLLTLYDFGMTPDGQPYFVMDFLEGTTLAKLLEKEGRLDPERAVAILAQVADALSEAHRKGIVHRDLKPANIVLIERDSTREFVKLVDFSIAKMSDGGTSDMVQLTVDGIICGSPAYMSPEQCRGGDVDQRSDIYSMGVLLFETLTGQRPFTAKDLVSLMYLHVNDHPPQLSDVDTSLTFPQDLEDMVKRALSKEPDKRQSSVEEFMSELTQSLKCLDFKAVRKRTEQERHAQSTLFKSPLASASEPESAKAKADERNEPSIDMSPDAPEKEAPSENESAPEEAPPPEVPVENVMSSSTKSADSFDQLPRAPVENFDPARSNESVLIKDDPGFNSGGYNAASVAQAPPQIPYTVPESRQSGESIAIRDTASQAGSSGAQPAPQARRKSDTKEMKSYAGDVAVMYKSEGRQALPTILPFIVILVLGGIAVLSLWDASTPDTPQEMIVKGRFDEAIAILEQKQRERRLTESEAAVLNSAYLSVAKAMANQKRYSQAIQILRKIPPGSRHSATADVLIRLYKRLSTLSGN